MFPESPILEEMRGALWSVRARWQRLGHVLGLPFVTLEVIKGALSIWLYARRN